MTQSLEWETISICVNIGRGIFQKYFPPTVFHKFDSDHKLVELINELFESNPEVIRVLDQKWVELERKINKRNTLEILQWNPRVDFEGFITEQLWEGTPTHKAFLVFLERIEEYEAAEKKKVFTSIDTEKQLSEEDYAFILELFAYERCSFSEFQKLFKFIRNTQYEWAIIIASLWNMRNKRYKKGFMNLIEKKGSKEEKEALTRIV